MNILCRIITKKPLFCKDILSGSFCRTILAGTNHGCLISLVSISRNLADMPGRRSLLMSNELFSSSLCSCGCGIKGMHTKGDRELVEFLQEEIVAEKKNLGGKLPSYLDDFTVKGKEAELLLTKKFQDEEITVTLSVNHTVDSEAPVELNPNTEGADVELKSRPSFEIDVKVGTKTLSFTCSYTGPTEQPEDEHPDDVFGINEVTVYDGEWTEDTYCVSGDILDGIMYDLLMNMLEERGITNEFAEKLSNLCTDYEHSLYVNMLQSLQDFVKRK